MKFRLLYEGPVAPRQRVNVGDLHSIRMHLHPQIKALWEFSPLSGCKRWLREHLLPGNYDLASLAAGGPDTSCAILERSNDVLFCPLISRKNRLGCELDITLLRQQAPGQLLGEGGDIDNRMKTLLDGLRKPTPQEAQQAHISKTADDDPIHCLLQDDALVTRLNVETDRLLRPAKEFHLVALIQVTVVLTQVTMENVELLSRAQ